MHTLLLISSNYCQRFILAAMVVTTTTAAATAQHAVAAGGGATAVVHSFWGMAGGDAFTGIDVIPNPNKLLEMLCCRQLCPLCGRDNQDPA